MTNEDILAENESLHQLITNNEINTFVKFPEKSAFSEAFIDWLSPKYYDTFVSIYTTHTGTKSQSKVVKLLNSPWFCNVETEEKIIDFLEPHFDSTIALAKKCSHDITQNSNDLVVILERSGVLLGNVISHLNKALFKHKHEKITLFKDKVIDESLSICEVLKKYKASSEIEFQTFNAILDRMKNIEFNATQQERYDICAKKSKSSAVKYQIVFGIIFIIAVIRLIAAFT